MTKVDVLRELPDGTSKANAELIAAVVMDLVEGREEEKNELLGLRESIMESRGYTRQGLEGACTNYGSPGKPLFRRGDLPRKAARKRLRVSTQADDAAAAPRPPEREAAPQPTTPGGPGGHRAAAPPRIAGKRTRRRAAEWIATQASPGPATPEETLCYQRILERVLAG